MTDKEMLVEKIIVNLAIIVVITVMATMAWCVVEMEFLM